FRLSRERLPSGLDFIAIPKTDAKPELKTLAKSIVDLSWRLSKRLKRDESAARRNKQEERSHAKAQRCQETHERPFLIFAPLRETILPRRPPSPFRLLFSAFCLLLSAFCLPPSRRPAHSYRAPRSPAAHSPPPLAESKSHRTARLAPNEPHDAARAPA